MSPAEGRSALRQWLAATVVTAEIELVGTSLVRSEGDATWPYIVVGGIAGAACAAWRARGGPWRPSAASAAPVTALLVVLLAPALRGVVSAVIGSGDVGAFRLVPGRATVGLVAAMVAWLLCRRAGAGLAVAADGTPRARARHVAVVALGAAVAAGTVSYLLLPAFGMRRAMAMAAGVDLALLLLASRTRAVSADAVADAVADTLSPLRRAEILAAGGLAGAVVVAWMRLLPVASGEAGTGAPVATAVLLGSLAAGAGLAGRLNRHGPLLIAAADAATGLTLLLGLPAWTAVSAIFFLGGGYAPGVTLFALLRLVAAVALVAAPAFSIGAEIALRRARGDELASGLGGAAVGAAATFLLAPLVGAQATFVVLGLGLVLLAGASVGVGDRPRHQRLVFLALSLGAAAFLVVSLPTWDLALVDGGAATAFTRRWPRASQWIPFREDPTGAPVVIVTPPVAHDPTEAKAAARRLVLLHDGEVVGGAATNEASARLALVPRLFLGASAPGSAPAALLLGLGTGAALDAIAAAPFAFERIDVVEPSAGVVEAVRAAFQPGDRGALDGSGVHLDDEDPRAFLSRVSRRYQLVLDASVSPSLRRQDDRYTVEGYRAVDHVLAERGVFAQTLPLARTATVDLARILASARRVFPSLTLWLVDGQLLLVGRREPLVADAADLRSWTVGDANAPGKPGAPSFTLFASFLAGDAGIDRFVADQASAADIAAETFAATDDSLVLATASRRDEPLVGVADDTLAALREQTDATLADHLRGLTDDRERHALYAAIAAARGWSHVAAAEVGSPSDAPWP